MGTTSNDLIMNTPRIDFSKYQHLIDRLPTPKHQTDGPPDQVDVMDAQEHYKTGYKAALGLTDKLQKRLDFLNNLKELQPWHERERTDVVSLLSVLQVFTQSTNVVVWCLQQREAQAYRDVAAAAEDEINIIMVMNDRIQRLKEQVQAKDEMISLLTDLL